MPSDPTPTVLDALAGRFQPLSEFFETRMRRENGAPYSKRAIQHLVRSGTVPTAKIGAVRFVDLERLAEKLARSPYKRKRRVRLDD